MGGAALEASNTFLSAALQEIRIRWWAVSLAMWPSVAALATVRATLGQCPQERVSDTGVQPRVRGHASQASPMPNRRRGPHAQPTPHCAISTVFWRWACWGNGRVEGETQPPGDCTACASSYQNRNKTPGAVSPAPALSTQRIPKAAGRSGPTRPHAGGAVHPRWRPAPAARSGSGTRASTARAITVRAPSCACVTTAWTVCLMTSR